MTRFRRKSYEVEAFQVTEANLDAPATWPDWAQQAAAKSWSEPGAISRVAGRPALMVRTLIGLDAVEPGAWIVRRPDSGALRTLADDEFGASFEEEDRMRCSDERVAALRRAEERARAALKPGDRLYVERCGGIRATVKFVGFCDYLGRPDPQGRCIQSKTLDDLHAWNVLRVNGVPMSFRDPDSPGRSTTSV